MSLTHAQQLCEQFVAASLSVPSGSPADLIAAADKLSDNPPAQAEFRLLVGLESMTGEPQ